MTGIARQTQYQLQHYFRATVLYSDVMPFYLGTLPGDAIPLGVDCDIGVAFNAGTTNVITVGSNSATYNNMVAAGTITPGTPGGYTGVKATVLHSLSPYNKNLTDNNLASPPGPTDVFINYTYTGTAPTTGQATIVLSYVPNNDI